MKSKYLILCVALVAALCGLVCESTYAQCGANGTAQCGASLVGQQNVQVATQLGLPTAFGALQAAPVCTSGACSTSASTAVALPQRQIVAVPQATYSLQATAPLVYQAAPVQTQIDVNAMANALRAAAPPVVYQAPQVYQAPVMAYQAPVYAAAPTMFASLSTVGGTSASASAGSSASAASTAAPPLLAAAPVVATPVALGGCANGSCSRSLSRSRSGGGGFFSNLSFGRKNVSTSRSTSRTVTR